MAMCGSVQQDNSGGTRGLLIGDNVTWLCQKGKKKNIGVLPNYAIA